MPAMGDLSMTTPSDAPDWRKMSQEERDLGLNNGVAVAGSADIVAGWERRSTEMRARYPDHLDLRYGPRERNRIDFLKAREKGPRYNRGGGVAGRRPGARNWPYAIGRADYRRGFEACRTVDTGRRESIGRLSQRAGMGKTATDGARMRFTRDVTQ